MVEMLPEATGSRRLSRRQLVAGGGALVGLVGLAGTLQAVRLQVAAPGAEVLSVEELGVVVALAEVFFPAGPLPSAAQADVALEVDRMVAEVLPPLQRGGFRYVLRSLEWGTLVSRGVRFSRLDLIGRTEVVEVWMRPEVMTRRVAFDAVRALLGMAYFRHPAVLKRMDWYPPCTGART